MKDSVKNIAYTLTKAGVASVPIVGAAASEILPLIVTPPLEKRRKLWLNDIGSRLQVLENKQSLNLEDLRANETFIDVVLECSTESIKTSQEEKIKYFQNAILNTALGDNPDLSETHIFIRLVSEYTVWHIKILSLFNDPAQWFKNNDKEFPQFMSAGLSSVLIKAYPELKERREFYDLIWADLHRSGMHNTSGLHAQMTGSGLMQSRTTEFGKKFLSFINKDPLE